MTDITVLRIRNPQAFLIPSLSTLVLEALGSSPFTKDPEAALLELVELIEHPALGIFVVREGTEYVAMALCENNSSALSPGCMVLHFYAPGRPEARRALLKAIADFARAGGNTKIWGVDVNRKAKGFARMFRALGAPVARGHLFEFDLTEGEL